MRAARCVPLLVDMARERMAQKRHAELMPLTLGADVPDLGGTPEQLVALDDALTRLGTVDDRLMRVAEMRVIMGMEVSEVALALGCPNPRSNATGNAPRLSCTRRWECRSE